MAINKVAFNAKLCSYFLARCSYLTHKLKSLEQLPYTTVFSTCFALMFIYFKITPCINCKFKYKICKKTQPLLPVTEKNN